MQKLVKYLLLGALGLIIGIGLMFYFKKQLVQAPTISQSSDLNQLAAVEVKEYEGQDLSSLKDFRENSIKGPQQLDRDSYRLKITGLTGAEQSLSYDQVVNSYPAVQKLVTLHCVEGWSVTILWEGVLLKALIDRSQVPPTAQTVIFRAADGYSTSFPVNYIFDRDIVLAYKMNDVELPPARGFPFQLVAEDKYGYKWIKWVTEIEFSADADYRGYWESRGYSNSGDLGESFFAQ